MDLANLVDKFNPPSIVLVQSSSDRYKIFVEDRLKAFYKCGRDSVITIETKTDLKQLKELSTAYPFFADRWFCKINIDKFSLKELLPLLSQAYTFCILLITNKYNNYKLYKQALAKTEGFKDYYVSYMPKRDYFYLCDMYKHIEGATQLTPAIENFIYQSYSSDVEAIFDILEAIRNGEKLDKRSEVLEIGGTANNATETFIFSCLRPISGSDKGLKKVIKDRIVACEDLASGLGYSTLYNYLAKNLITLIQLKQLIICGKVYKKIEELPEGYSADEKSLLRMQRYIYKLDDIPMSQLLRLRKALGGVRWVSSYDVLAFIYRYYYELALLQIK